MCFTVTNDLSYDQRMHKICSTLSSYGYNVTLVGRLLPTSIELPSKNYKQVRLKCHFTKGKLFYIEYNLRLFLFLFKQQYNAICAIDLDTITAVYLSTFYRRKTTKLVYDAHEYFTEVPEVVRRPNVQKVWKWVERTFVPKFDLMYTVSPALAQLFEDKYKVKFGVVMNAPAHIPGQSASKIPINPVTIFYQGALNEGRGLEQLLEAMKDIDARLLIAGEGDLSKKLRLMADVPELKNKVEFLGMLSPDKLREITPTATIGYNLLENKGLSYYYSLSNKFFDYAHAGVPQLCIDFPEYKKLNREQPVALLVKTCNAHEIKMGINRLLSEPGLYQKLKGNCKPFIEQYNWQNEANKLTVMYEQLFR